jgi:DNA-binding beta-propeller fold protein YncE
MKNLLLLLAGLFFFFQAIEAKNANTIVSHPEIGTISTPDDAEVKLLLKARIKAYSSVVKDTNDYYDTDINSPKSVEIFETAGKFYVNSLEGCETIVYDLHTLKKLKVIKHTFSPSKSYLFTNELPFGYTYSDRTSNPNIFSGKPVECTFTHNKKYLWVTYYRRSYDTNAQEPSAVAIIDTETDTIVRVMPCGPLPKMIAASHNNKYVAITHWGDNTVSLVDISSDKVSDWKFVKQVVIDYKMTLSYNDSIPVNRDENCGHCLRGTTFTPDDKYLFVGKMGGGGGIAIIDMDKMKYVRTVEGMRTNLRHLVVTDSTIYASANSWGIVQKTSLAKFLQFVKEDTSKKQKYTQWDECAIGVGARTISVTKDEKYIFAAVNNSAKVAVIRSEDMKKICEVDADSFPVGLSLTDEGDYVIVTAQGREGYTGTGNSVMIYKVDYNNIADKTP